MDVALDLACLALLLLFCINGIWKGAYVELLGLVHFALSLLVATIVHVVVIPEVLYHLGQSYFNSNLVYGISLILVFMIAWFVLKILFSLLLLLTNPAGKKNPASLVAGGIIGTAKGLVVIIMLIMAADYTSVTEQSFWKNSRTVDWMMPFAHETRDGLVYIDSFARENIQQLIQPYLPEESKLLNEAKE